MPFYISSMFLYSDAGHSYNLRTEYILEDHGSDRPSGDNCIHHFSPSAINKSKPDILDKISTQIYILYKENNIK